ncbi:DUF305 domain-containing protein [Dactylosporangium darangshiense]|uniref:DUF305 domain-containing protein n=1 Tax=Dactylosporangium darangshiense TaxID=579108 RepID=A0ABP8D632_9ACTN
MFAQLSRRARLSLGVLAAILLLVTGTAVGYLIPTLRAPGDDSIDAGFARDMSVHHAQAVEMGMFAYRLGTTDDIRNLGYDIAASQQWQIGQMQTWLVEWHLSPTSSNRAMSWMPSGMNTLQPDGRMPGMASADDLKRLKSATGKDFDTLWCQLMLRHHLGGIHMAEIAAKDASSQEVRDAAEKMRVAQSYDISQLTEKLKDLGAQPLSS